jgi:threonyl-tRNA synthetase
MFGSFERFIGILLEHLDGQLPVWLSPVQAIVLPITDRQNEAAAAVLAALQTAGLRGELDARSESVGRKIRDAQLRKLPYMLVIGEREAAAGTVAVRERSAGDIGVVSLEEFVERLRTETSERSR